MKFKLLLLVLLISGALSGLKAQDSYHYTLFDFTEIAMNPALAGSFEGTVRGGGIFREQDFGLTVGQYRNPLAYLDLPVIRGFAKSHWIGIGMFYQYDVQAISDKNLITNKFFGGLAYHIGFDKENKNVLSLGIQSGSANAYITTPTEGLSTYTLYSDVQKNDPALDALNIREPSGSGSGSGGTGTNWVGGIHFRSKMTNTQVLNLGFSVSNIYRVSNSILSQGSFSQQPYRYLFHGSFRTPLVDKIDIEPRLFFQYQRPSWDLSVQSLFHFILNPETSVAVNAGLGYNLQNGLQFMAGYSNENLKAGFSFDLNLSDKTQVSGPAAAFELGIAYILKFYKKPKPDPVLVCPRI